MALEQSISDLLGLPNGIDDFADKRNNELLHEQLFYEDETKYPNNSIGWSSGGKNPLFGKGDFLHEPFSNGYVVTSSGYNDCVMHKAEKLVGKPPHYLLVGPILFYQQNNCQDWAQRLRDKYYELLGDPKVVCECGLHILIVR